MGDEQRDKSTRRKVSEVIFYLWGVFGFFMLLVMAHRAMDTEASLVSINKTMPAAVLLILIVYCLIWIGGLIFLGLFVQMTPSKAVPQAVSDQR